MSAITRNISELWDRFFFTGCSGDQLGLSRIFLGTGLIFFHWLQFRFILGLDLDGRTFHFLNPIWYFRALGIQSVDPTVSMMVLGVLVVATIGFAFGAFTRTSLIIMLVSIMFLKGVRDSTTGDVHHRYLIPFNILLFFLLSRCGDAYSIDAWRRRGRETVSKIAEWEASWPIKAAQLYICSFYLWSAIAKMRMTGPAWGSIERIQGLLLSRSTRFGFEDGIPAGSELAFALAHNDFACQIMASMTYVFEFGFILILLIRSTWLRLAFFAGVTFFHVGNYVLINVQFLLLPIVFLLFFDISVPFRRFLGAEGRS